MFIKYQHQYEVVIYVVYKDIIYILYEHVSTYSNGSYLKYFKSVNCGYHTVFMFKIYSNMCVL